MESLEFFERAVREWRTYEETKDGEFHYRNYVRSDPNPAVFEQLEESDKLTRFRARHALDPVAGGLDEIARRTRIPLPEELGYFIRHFGSGNLYFKRSFEILTPKFIWELCKREKQTKDIRVVPFCTDDFGDVLFVVREIEGSWDVAFVQRVSFVEHAGLDLKPDDWNYPETEPSFVDWLRRMVDTDGVPVIKGDDSEEPVRVRRVMG